MSSSLGDPAPHAKAYTSFGSPVTLTPPATAGIILSNFAAGAASISFTTVGGESVTMSEGTPTTASAPVWLPIQVARIDSVSNIGTVIALWH